MNLVWNYFFFFWVEVLGVWEIFSCNVGVREKYSGGGGGVEVGCGGVLK